MDMEVRVVPTFYGIIYINLLFEKAHFLKTQYLQFRMVLQKLRKSLQQSILETLELLTDQDLAQ